MDVKAFHVIDGDRPVLLEFYRYQGRLSIEDACCLRAMLDLAINKAIESSRDEKWFFRREM